MFKIVHDLSSLSETERKQYLRDYSEFLGLNPDQNRLDMIWMNGDSVRQLVAYCRRGTTDILRDIHGIDVTQLVKEDGPGYISFQASGINRRGRKEIAVGAYTTLGLTGDRLAAAVATAQTRAVRRLTLQFVGGGLLDETEVNSQPVDTTAMPVTAPPVFPQTKPNEEVGKLREGVTSPSTSAIATALDAKVAADLKVEYHVPLPPHSGMVAVGIPTFTTEPNKEVGKLTTPPLLPVTQRFPPMPKLTPDPAPQPAIPASVEAANAILAESMGSEPGESKKRGRKPRKSKNSVDMGTESEGPQPVLEQPVQPKVSANANNGSKLPPVLTYIPICPDCNDFMAEDSRLDVYMCTKHDRINTKMKPSVVNAETAKTIAEHENKILNSAPVQGTPVSAAPVIPEVKPVEPTSVLTKDEQKQVKARLAPFWVDILPKGGMTADDGISIWGKLIKFTSIFFPESSDYKRWTFDEWESFFEFLDEYNTKNGPAALVSHINSRIGAK